MRSEKQMFDLILKVAQEDQRVKAVLLNGSRANPSEPKDIYQDFDIVYVVDEIESWIIDHQWIDVFGPRIMLQMPELMRNPSGDGNFAYLILFEDGQRIDLTLAIKANLKKQMSEEMNVVLLDKENLFTQYTFPDVSFDVKTPTQREYSSCCNNFFWCLQNVAKGIARDQWPYAMGMFEWVVRKELMEMLSWQIGVLTNFTVSSGKMGKYFGRYLPTDQYQLYLLTYDTKDADHLWQAIFRAINCFEKAAACVGSSLDFEYQVQDHRNMVNYLKRFKNTLEKKKKQESVRLGKDINHYLDSEGRIVQWPSKLIMKNKVLDYLSTKFSNDGFYSESQVNDILKQWHTFNDYFILRRGLIDSGWLKRHRDGSQYWKNPQKSDIELSMMVDNES